MDVYGLSPIQQIALRIKMLILQMVLQKYYNIGTCAINNLTSITTLSPTYCSVIKSLTDCAQTIGCANFNSTCTIFSGCSAYVQ